MKDWAESAFGKVNGRRAGPVTTLTLTETSVTTVQVSPLSIAIRTATSFPRAGPGGPRGRRRVVRDRPFAWFIHRASGSPATSLVRGIASCADQPSLSCNSDGSPRRMSACESPERGSDRSQMRAISDSVRVNQPKENCMNRLQASPRSRGRLHADRASRRRRRSSASCWRSQFRRTLASRTSANQKAARPTSARRSRGRAYYADNWRLHQHDGRHLPLIDARIKLDAVDAGDLSATLLHPGDGQRLHLR